MLDAPTNASHEKVSGEESIKTEIPQPVGDTLSQEPVGVGVLEQEPCSATMGEIAPDSVHEIPEQQPEQELKQEHGEQSVPMPEHTKVQTVPCPICQKNIPVYANPCPECGGGLSWQ